MALSSDTGSEHLEEIEERYMQSAYQFLHCASTVARKAGFKESSLGRTVQLFTADVLPELTNALLQPHCSGNARRSNWQARLKGTDGLVRVMQALMMFPRHLYITCVSSELYPDFMRMLEKFGKCRDEEICRPARLVHSFFLSQRHHFMGNRGSRPASTIVHGEQQTVYVTFYD